MLRDIIDAMNTTRTITHSDNHTDIETYLQDVDGVWVWAVTKCGQKQEKQAMTKATYEFDYAMRQLRGAIEYAKDTGVFEAARIWANRVEESYQADIKAEQELTANANEGARLLHSLATGGESELLKSWDLPSGDPRTPAQIDADEQDADWQAQVSGMRS